MFFIFIYNYFLSLISRSSIYSLFGIYSFNPVIGWYLMNDMKIQSVMNHILALVCHGTGLILYMTRFPEKYFRGKFKLFHSHLYFHIMTIFGNYYAIKGIHEMSFQLFLNKYI